MGAALREAARRAGIRLTLARHVLPRRGDRRAAPAGATAVQRRQTQRPGRLVRSIASRTRRPGSAWPLHSVRAVPVDAFAIVGGDAGARSGPTHRCTSTSASSRPRTRPRSRRTARTPVEALADHGLLGPWTTAVHATHLTSGDIARLGAAGAYACFCPTTERDLADGIGPARALRDAGARLTLGLRPARRDRPARGGARAGDARAAGDAWSAGGSAPAELVARADRRRARQPRLAGGRPDRTRRAGRPGRGAAGHACARPESTRPRSCSPPPPPTSTRVIVGGEPVVTRRRAPARGRRRAAAARDPTTPDLTRFVP